MVCLFINSIPLSILQLPHGKCYNKELRLENQKMVISLSAGLWLNED